MFCSGSTDMKLFRYEGKHIQVTDNRGRTFTGIAKTFPAEDGFHMYNRAEEGIRIGENVIFDSDIEAVEFFPTFEEAVRTIPPGRYRHFKGNEYEVIAIARHSETGEPMVVYQALYGERGIWVRPAGMWNETVERDGESFQRFEQIMPD